MFIYDNSLMSTDTFDRCRSTVNVLKEPEPNNPLKPVLNAFGGGGGGGGSAAGPSAGGAGNAAAQMLAGFQMPQVAQNAPSTSSGAAAGSSAASSLFDFANLAKMSGMSGFPGFSITGHEKKTKDSGPSTSSKYLHTIILG